MFFSIAPWYDGRMLNKKLLRTLYIDKKQSLTQIATKTKSSINRVVYWMDRHGIKRRSIGEAVYVRCHPRGDPFLFSKPKSSKEALLFGMGLGLYWGEGTKANLSSVRLGNTDPKLIRTFMNFLMQRFRVKRKDFRFSLQIFSDIKEKGAKRFWIQALGVRPDQFTKSTLSPSQSQGTYKRRSKHGVATLYYHNKKLRDLS